MRGERMPGGQDSDLPAKHQLPVAEPGEGAERSVHERRRGAQLPIPDEEFAEIDEIGR